MSKFFIIISFLKRFLTFTSSLIIYKLKMIPIYFRVNILSNYKSKKYFCKELYQKGILKHKKFLLSKKEINEIETYLDSSDKDKRVGKDFFNNFPVSLEGNKNILRILSSKFPNLYNIINDYCYGEAVLESGELIVSKFISKKLQKSQLFHKDYNSEKIIKIFIYLNDVEKIENGPLLFLKHYKKSIRDILIPIPIHKNLCWEENTVKKGAEIEPLTLKKGGFFFIDTYKNFHSGSRIIDTNFKRKAIILTFRHKIRWIGKDYQKTVPISNFI